jgi:flagellar motor switch protein FliM
MPNRTFHKFEMDEVSRNLSHTQQDDDPSKHARTYDFRRADRIAKDQMRAIRLLHENFARNLASSLSGYLHAYVAVTLIAVEELSSMEFWQNTSRCLVSLGMRPYEGNAVLDLDPELAFRVI